MCAECSCSPAYTNLCPSEWEHQQRTVILTDGCCTLNGGSQKTCPCPNPWNLNGDCSAPSDDTCGPRDVLNTGVSFVNVPPSLLYQECVNKHRPPCVCVWPLFQSVQKPGQNGSNPFWGGEQVLGNLRCMLLARKGCQGNTGR